MTDSTAQTPVVLFDIDGTLMRSDMDLHLDAMLDAIDWGAGRPTRRGVRRGLGPHGITDSAIAEAMLRRHHDNDDGAIGGPQWREFWSNYAVAHQFRSSSTPESVFEDTRSALLEMQRYATLGLLTGNARKVARQKLQRHGLDRYFRWRISAFGDEAVHRPDLVPIAIDRINREIGPRPLVLIGDTPNDVAAARQNKVGIIAVSTGVYTEKTLREVGAKSVARSLSEAGEILLRTVESGDYRPLGTHRAGH